MVWIERSAVSKEKETCYYLVLWCCTFKYNWEGEVLCDFSSLSFCSFSSFFFYARVSIARNTIQISAGRRSLGSRWGPGSRFPPCPHYPKTSRSLAKSMEKAYGLMQAMSGDGTLLCVFCSSPCARAMCTWNLFLLCVSPIICTKPGCWRRIFLTNKCRIACCWGKLKASQPPVLRYKPRGSLRRPLITHR